jgi:hypothetical protein
LPRVFVEPASSGVARADGTEAQVAKARLNQWARGVSDSERAFIVEVSKQVQVMRTITSRIRKVNDEALLGACAAEVHDAEGWG